QVLAKGRRPIDVVSMGCEVEFRDESTGRVQKLILVDPREADIEQRKISVLTPVGTALIGLRTGTSITWETRTGELKRLTVMGVRNAPKVESAFSMARELNDHRRRSRYARPAQSCV